MEEWQNQQKRKRKVKVIGRQPRVPHILRKEGDNRIIQYILEKVDARSISHRREAGFYLDFRALW